MKRISFAGIGLLFLLGLAGNGFTEEAVTNRQILEKLNSMDVRIARIEERQESLQKQINGIEVSIARLEEGQKSLQKQIDDLKTLVLGGFGIIFAGIFALIGFVLWDRRTALAPAVKKMEALEERELKLEKILKEYAGKEQKLATVMRSMNL